MQELATARAPRCFVRVLSGPYNYKVVHFCTIRLAIDDVAMAYSQLSAILLLLL
jgi:hypothetical protein